MEDFLLVLTIFTTLFGLVIGSFLNVVIHRIPLEQSIVHPPSACPKCKHKIRWYENIPLISYIFILRGKCSGCSTKISMRYPMIEALCGLIAFLLAPKYYSPKEIMVFLVYFSIACSFLAHFLIDIKYQILPDKINLYLLAIIFPFVLLNFPFQHWLIGGLIGFLGPFGVTYAFYKLRGQIGLGGGDIKLFGILGLYLGPIGILNNIFLSCMLGAIVGSLLILTKRMGRETPFAFGPFIIIVGSLQIFLPGVAQHLNLFGLQ